MRKNSFIPGRDSELDTFEENFRAKLSVHSAALGIDPEEAAAITSLINIHKTAFANMVDKRHASKAAKEENKAKKKILLSELRRISRQIKALKGYTEAIGDDLGIIGPQTVASDSGEKKPQITAKTSGHLVILKYKKNGSNGIRIYCKRGNETDYSFLALSTVSPFTDDRPNLQTAVPEKREYYCYFFDGSTETGRQSDIVKATVA